MSSAALFDTFMNSILAAQIIVLFGLYRGVSSVLSESLASIRSSPDAESEKDRVTQKPRVATLPPDHPDGKWRPSIEWEPFTNSELNAVDEMVAWIGSETMSLVPHDVLAMFIRGFGYRHDHARASCAFLDSSITWRQQWADAAMFCPASALPPKRQLFERCILSGPVGETADGHPVILDRLCCVPVSTLLREFDDDEFIRHLIYNRECMRACWNVASHRQQRRVHKVVNVIDLKGLSLEHASKQLMMRIKKVNAVIAYNYPESVHRIYVINAPIIFSAIFTLLKAFLHPLTVAKLRVCGPNYESIFREEGVHLFGGAVQVPELPTPWTDVIDVLRRDHPADTLRQCWRPPEDVEALRRKGLDVDAQQRS
mmetsp:Transcript_48995/g.127890  ORF Transcript_48995/g.127890 Transcript_48995/m.127890 type:complete len:370 (+) Transcript_48995:66-1175(+)